MRVGSKKKVLLFVCYGGGHFNALLPVIRTLLNSGEFTVHLLGLTAAYKPAVAAGIRTWGFVDLLDPKEKQAIESGKRLASELPESDLVSHNESIAYLGLNFQEMVEKYGQDEAENKYKKEGRHVFLPVHTVGRLLDRLTPDLVITTNAPRAERATILAAVSRKIPSLCIGDLFLPKEWRWMVQSDFASKIAVFSQSVKTMLVNKGRSQADIQITGNPAFDSLADLEKKVSGVQRRASLGWGNKRVVLWALPPSSQYNDGRKVYPLLNIYDALRDTVVNHSNIRVYIRPHPNGVPVELSESIANLPVGMSVTPEGEHPHVSIYASDVVFSEFSTLIVEGVMVGKPAITIGMGDDTVFTTHRVAVNLKSHDLIQETLVSIENSAAPDLGIPKIGTATTNVVNLIHSMLNDERMPILV